MHWLYYLFVFSLIFFFLKSCVKANQYQNWQKDYNLIFPSKPWVNNHLLISSWLRQPFPFLIKNEIDD